MSFTDLFAKLEHALADLDQKQEQVTILTAQLSAAQADVAQASKVVEGLQADYHERIGQKHPQLSRVRVAG